MEQILDQLTQHLEQTDGWTLDLVAHGMLAQAVFCFIYMQFSKAPYGKYTSPGSATVNAHVAWLVFELPSILVPIVLLCTRGSRVRQSANVFFVTLFTIHYINRSLIYPLLLRSNRFPVLIFFMAGMFATTNTCLQCVHLLYRADYPSDWAAQPSVWIGVALFLVGMAVNIHSDYLLRSLRRPGETAYKIPRGGMFEYVSGANFLGEIVEWVGFAVATWSYPALTFAVSTAVYLGTRACHHHRFYQQKFEDYPKNRKAVIPFVL